MSLYGNIKRIGSQSFQFDRVYSNRKQMDDACLADGVYPGRYVLVEYGERYRPATQDEINDNTKNKWDRQGIIIVETDGSAWTTTDGITRTDNYAGNRLTDQNAYRNVYDSTVWQKVFTKDAEGNNVEKYIMVAELNALAPKLTLVEDETATLVPVEDGDTDEEKLFYGASNAPLHGVKEIQMNSPYFDEIQDTELEYRLHMPKPLELDVNQDVNYHQDKFNIYRSYNTSASGGNFIGWKPVVEDPTEQDNIDLDTEANTANLTEAARFSKQELNMYLPAFGDVLGALYDTLFGHAATDGGIRPYFAAQGITTENFDPETGTITDPTAFTGDADVSKILANNSEGLAGVLRALFKDTSLPGQIRYFLSADWMAKNTDKDTNIPGIINKPKVVFASDKEDIDSSYNSHYQISYADWTLTNILFAIIKSIKGIESSNDNYSQAIDSFNYNDVSKFLEIVGDISDFGENKTISLDIDTRFPDVNDISITNGGEAINFEAMTSLGHLLLNLNLEAIAAKASGETYVFEAPNCEPLRLLIQFIKRNHLLQKVDKAIPSNELINQNKIFVVQDSGTQYSIVCDLTSLTTTTINNEIGKWIGIKIDTKDTDNNLSIQPNITNRDVYQITEPSEGSFYLYLNTDKIENDFITYDYYGASATQENSLSSIIKTETCVIPIASTAQVEVIENGATILKNKFEDVNLTIQIKNIPIVYDIFKLTVPESYTEGNVEQLKNNISKITLNNSDLNNLIISTNYQTLDHFSHKGEDGHWIPLVIDTNVSDITKLMLNRSPLNDTNVNETVQFEQNLGNIILWIKLEAFKNNPVQAYNLSIFLSQLLSINDSRYAVEIEEMFRNNDSNVLSKNLMTYFNIVYQGAPVLNTIRALPVENTPNIYIEENGEQVSASKYNQGQFIVIPTENGYDIKVKTDYAKYYTSTDSSQSADPHQWIALDIQTNCIGEPYKDSNDEWIGGIRDVYWQNQQLQSIDIDDVRSVGLPINEGHIILWLKGEQLGEKSPIGLTADYYTPSSLNLTLSDYDKHTIQYNSNGRGTSAYIKESQTSYNDEPLIVQSYFNNAHYLVDKDIYINSLNERRDEENLNSAPLNYDLQGGIWQGNPGPGTVKWTSDVYTYPQKIWNTQADGSGDFYEAGDNYVDINNNTLYAIWDDEQAAFTGKTGEAYILPESIILINSIPAKPEKWQPFTGSIESSTKSLNFYPDSNTLEGKIEQEVQILGCYDFLEWQNENGITRTANTRITHGETIYAVYEHSISKFETQRFTLPTITKENYTLLGWSDNINSNIIKPGYEPGEQVIYTFTDSNKIDNLNFYAIWEAYLQILFKDLDYGNNNKSMMVPHNSNIILLEYFDNYTQLIETPLTITIDDTDIDNWDTTTGNSITASATYATSQMRYRQQGWECDNISQAEYTTYQILDSDKEFTALWDNGTLEVLDEPIGLTYTVPSAVPQKNTLIENIDEIKYYYVLNDQLLELEQSTIVYNNTDYTFTGWENQNTHDIRTTTNNSSVIQNEIIQPIFDETSYIPNVTLYGGDIGVQYYGWSRSLNNIVEFNKGANISYTNGINILYAVQEDPALQGNP